MAEGPPAPQRLSALRDNDDDYGSGPSAASHNALLDAMAGRQIRREEMPPDELRRQIKAMREFEATAEHRRQEQRRAAQSLDAARSHYQEGLETGRLQRLPPPSISLAEWSATPTAGPAYYRDEFGRIVRNPKPRRLTFDERVELANVRRDHRMRHPWR